MWQRFENKNQPDHRYLRTSFAFPKNVNLLVFIICSLHLLDLFRAVEFTGRPRTEPESGNRSGISETELVTVL